ncbi:carboxypeptidase regulatory-like domain-containing protein, partial [Clostridium tarantellae]
MQIRRDNYNLGKSNNIEVFSNNLDIKADIVLATNERELNVGSAISGIVVDTLNNPIKNALVKLINSSLESLASVRTDENGKYVISIVPSSSMYTILTTATDKVVNQSPSFTLKKGENKFINFTLSSDANAFLGAISGTLKDINNNVISGAIISLYKENENSNLFSITYSDNQGTFFFNELLPGNYKILIYSLTHISHEESITVKSKRIYSFNKLLTFNPNISAGSISGTITDNLGNAISKADVILYKIENNIKTPVAFTQTNSFGTYNFLNVPFGSYLVKSNSTQSLDFNPVVTPSVKITSTSELETYNLSTGILENDALFDYSTGFITALGGEKDGSVTLSVNVEKYGIYNLAIYYLAADFNRPLTIEVNGKELEEIYKVPITPGWEIDATKIFNISVILNEGLNTLKFHGDGINLAPNLSKVTLIFNETESSPMVTTTLATSDNSYFKSIAIAGSYSNGANYNKETLLATALGGTTDGTVTVEIYIRDTAIYYMTIKYIAKLSNLNLKVDVNNEKDNTIYTLPETDSFISKAFILPVSLKRGNNTIKFHGDGKNPAPDLDSFILNLPPLTQNLTEGILENGAKLDESKFFVSNIGGTENGSVTVAINVANYAYYKVFLSYLGTKSNLSLKVDVNGINTNTIIYSLPPTKGLAINDTKVFEFTVKLNSGNNTLRFHGNGTDLAPNLISFLTSFFVFSWEKLPTIQDVYDIDSAKLGGSATLDKKTNLITSLGGKNKGYFTQDIYVKYEGQYVLRIVYRNNRKFLIDVNGQWTGKVYTTIGGFRDIFNIPINLNAKENTIKIYGHDDELAPDFGDIYVDLNYPITPRIKEGLFLNGADYYEAGNIGPIGGPDNSSYTLYYFAEEYTEYTLGLVLSTEGKSLLININGITTETIYSIPPSNTPTIAYNINVVLNDGDNFIEFYGNGADYAPDIYDIDIKPTFTPVSKFTYNLVDANLKNGATIDLNKNFVQNIGTEKNGTAILTVKIDTEDFYDLNIQYIPLNVDSPLRVTVNNKSTKETYYLPLLENPYHNTFNVFVVPKILLTKGNNTIEFYGNGSDLVAKLGKVRISKFKEVVSLPEGIYYAVNGKVENGAKKATFSSNFVDGLGGSNEDGSVTIKANVEMDGFYNLLIEYLTDGNNKNLIIDINGENTGTIYTLPKTDDLKEEFSKNFAVPVVLKKGDNTIKFHGDNSINAPSLGKIYINKTPKITTYNFLNAILTNANILDYPEDFLSLIKGDDESFATVKINIESEGIYYLTIKYLSKDNSYINLKLNNEIIESKILFSPTKSENTIDSKSLTIKIKFNSGENILSFVKINDINFPPPLLGSFTISDNELIQTFPMEKALLLKGASLDKQTKFVEGIGGFGNGYAIVNVKVLQSGLYDMTLNYMSLRSARKLKLTINNVAIKNTFVLPMTEYSSKTFVIPISLKYGNNSIKIHGDRNMKEGPMIDELTLSLNTSNPIKNYNFSDGITTSEAMIDKVNKLVSDIGGKNKGEVTLNLNVAVSDFYDLYLQYKSPSKSNILFVDTNNNSNIENYTLPMTFDNDFGEFQITIPLKTGENSIKFYGDITNDNLILYNFNLTINT